MTAWQTDRSWMFLGPFPPSLPPSLDLMFCRPHRDREVSQTERQFSPAPLDSVLNSGYTSAQSLFLLLPCTPTGAKMVPVWVLSIFVHTPSPAILDQLPATHSSKLH